jgi:hypothetical protein
MTKKNDAIPDDIGRRAAGVDWSTRQEGQSVRSKMTVCRKTVKRLGGVFAMI